MADLGEIQGSTKDDAEKHEVAALPEKPVTRKRKRKHGQLTSFKRRFLDPFNRKKTESLKHQKAYSMKILANVCNTLSPRVNVQTMLINCTNSVEYDNKEDLEELAEATEEIATKVTEKIDDMKQEVQRLQLELAQMRQDASQNHKQLNVRLDEQKALLTYTLSKVPEYKWNNLEDCQAFKDIKDFVEVFAQGKTDNEVFHDGIQRLREDIVSHLDYDYSLFPLPVKHMIARVQHILGRDGLGDLCKALDVTISDNITAAEPSDAGNAGMPVCRDLNEDSCAMILLKWVNASSENTPESLCQRLDEFTKIRIPVNERKTDEMAGTSQLKDNDTSSEHSDQTYSSMMTPLFGSTRDISLSMHEGYFDYCYIEKQMLHLLKIIQFEGLNSAVETCALEETVL